MKKMQILEPVSLLIPTAKLHRHLHTAFVAFIIIFSGLSSAQTKVDIEAFKARSKETSENLKKDIGEDVTSITWTDPNKVILEQWRYPDGKIYTRQLKSSYVFLVPGPGGHFLRKAWLSEKGDILEEERRAYDPQNRLIVEGYVDPLTGSYTLEYRHRYSPDGKTQYTTEYANGIQKGEETSRVLQQSKTIDYPFASAVPDKKGFVFSPHTNQVIDVRNIKPRALVEDPTSKGNFFRVP